MYCKGVLPCIGIYPDAIPFCTTRFPWGTGRRGKKARNNYEKTIAQYESLPQDLQQIVDECAAEAVTYDRQICIDKEADYIKTIEDGGCQLTRLTDEQRQAFRDSTAGCLDFFKANYNPVIPVDDVLAAVNESNARFPG